MHRIVLVELNLSFNLEKHILESDQNCIFGCHACFNKVIDLNNTSSLLFLIFFNDLSDFIKQLLKLKPTDLDFGLVIHFIDQFISLLFDLVVGWILLGLTFLVFVLALFGCVFVVRSWWLFLLLFVKQVHHVSRTLLKGVNQVESQLHVVVGFDEFFANERLAAAGVGFEVIDHVLLLFLFGEGLFFGSGFGLLVLFDFGLLSKVFFLFFPFVFLSFFVGRTIVVNFIGFLAFIDTLRIGNIVVIHYNKLRGLFIMNVWI